MFSGTSSGDIRLPPVRRPAYRQRELNSGFCVELGTTCFLYTNGKHLGTCRLGDKGAIQTGKTRENLSTDTRRRGGLLRSSVEASAMGVERRGRIVWFYFCSQPTMGGAVEQNKVVSYIETYGMGCLQAC